MEKPTQKGWYNNRIKYKSQSIVISILKYIVVIINDDDDVLLLLRNLVFRFRAQSVIAQLDVWDTFLR